MLFKYTIDLVREGFKKDVDLSTFWWVDGSGWGQNPQKNLPLKFILEHFQTF